MTELRKLRESSGGRLHERKRGAESLPLALCVPLKRAARPFRSQARPDRRNFQTCRHVDPFLKRILTTHLFQDRISVLEPN